MILVLNVVQSVLNRLLIRSSNHHKTHTITSSFTDDSGVGIIVKTLLELVVDVWVFGGHTNEAQSKTDAMDDGLLLATVSVTINEIVFQVLGVSVLMDEAVSEVGTSGCVWRWGALLLWSNGTGEVWLQDFESTGLVSTVNDTQGSSGVESIPVGSLSYPWKVIIQESIIGGVSIHDSIRPNSSSVKNRALGSNSLLDSMDHLNIGVIVLLQELEVESISDLSLQNRLNLGQPLFGLCLVLFASFNFSFDKLRNLTLI